MGKSIDGIKATARNKGSRIAPAPQLIRSMSHQPVIPWRVALPQSPTPLHRPKPESTRTGLSAKPKTANGNCAKQKLSQLRGSPHSFLVCFDAFLIRFCAPEWLFGVGKCMQCWQHRFRRGFPPRSPNARDRGHPAVLAAFSWTGSGAPGKFAAVHSLFRMDSQEQKLQDHRLTSQGSL